jgi:succinyl-CoA synthetase beta subunit
MKKGLRISSSKLKFSQVDGERVHLQTVSKGVSDPSIRIHFLSISHVSPSEAKLFASQMIGQKLITKQTGPAGKICNAVYVCEKKYIRREFYLAILMDRGTQGPMIVASSQGGVDIETVAAENPDAIITLPVAIADGLSQEDAVDLAKRMNFAPQCVEKAAETISKLYQIFVERDATQIEINPLAESSDHRVMAMDAKFGFDDNAAFRQEEVFGWRDRTQENPDEVKAAEFGLNFIKLDVRLPMAALMVGKHRMSCQWSRTSYGYHGYY